MTRSNHGITRDEQGPQQPADKSGAQSARRSVPKAPASREATREPRLNDPEKTPGSGMAPDDEGNAPTG